ncbi:M15 family metallopeptidase [Pedobacter sp. R-06]|uniref:M15 family metallopeptidase n=1 Tax=Pedobacter sp. R-06 TaxID=3404051 RepID=UPI003CFAE033
MNLEMHNQLFFELTVELQSKLKMTIDNCEKRNVKMQIIEGLRNPFLQAIYWRQSRKIKEIKAKIDELNEAQAFFLSFCIKAVGSQYGTFATNAIPGFSWHQWGEAADCVWVIQGKKCWDLNLLVDNINGYRVYAEEARKVGLDCGFFWPHFQDACHVQLKEIAGPDKLISIKDIDLQMQIRFEDLIK